MPRKTNKPTVHPANLRERVQNDFTYHAPFGDQVQRYGQLRDAGKSLALLIVEMVPTSREQSLALTSLEEAIMWANAGIARNEQQEPPKSDD
jgi:hypothetical protein